jgi:hypothetical protein
MRVIVLEIVIILSCNDVVIKKVNSIAPAPKCFMILESHFAGIFFGNSIKNMAKLADRKIIPPMAQKRDVLFSH